jgi:Arginine-tRNA-protein transferase, C terminus
MKFTGKYTAIKEIEFCIENKLKYYYMGFYIHSCKKMRYKGEYEPSELLCPTALDWHPYKESIKLLEKNKFSPLNKKFIAEFEAVLEKEKVEKSMDKSEIKFTENTVDREIPNSESTSKNKNKSEIKDEKTRRKKSKENDNETENVKESETADEDQKPDPLEVMQTSLLKIFSPRFNYTPTTSSTVKTKNKNDTNSTDSHITDLDRKELASIPLDLGDGKRREIFIIMILDIRSIY